MWGAESAAADGATYAAMATMAVTTVGALGAALFAWLKDRDKFRHDARLAVLEEALRTTNEQMAELRQAERDCREREQVLRRQIEDLYRRIARLDDTPPHGHAAAHHPEGET